MRAPGMAGYSEDRLVHERNAFPSVTGAHAETRYPHLKSAVESAFSITSSADFAGSKVEGIRACL
jgi:hypothetical protein